MYSNLPRSEEELCELIKSQLIHPFDLVKFEGDLGRERRFEDLDFVDVRSILCGLAERGRQELSLDRTPQERLVVACWHHSLLLTSMLRHQGVPVRMRAGFAKYIGRESGLHVGHVLCEVWDESRGRWFLVDPDRKMVDVKRSEFEFASDAWEALRDGAEVGVYRSAHYRGSAAIAHLLTLDMRSVLRHELPYWYGPDIVGASGAGLAALDARQLEVLDRVASCLGRADEHLDELESIRSSSEFLREVDHSEEMKQHMPN